MDGKEVARIVKRACAAAGYTENELKRYAGHSLRAGFITEAAERGAQAWQIAEQSGHKPGSKVLESYIRAAGRGALAAISLMAQTDNGADD
jgi:integrase